MRRVFLSHAATDRSLAEYVRDALGGPGLDFFMASKPGHIRPGEAWFETILKELRLAETYLVLLTRMSFNRLWVAFETGAAWMTGRPLILLCAGGLKKREVQPPLDGLQLVSLDEDGRDAVAQVCWALRRRVMSDDEAERFLARAAELGQAGIEAARHEQGWEGVSVGDRFFAWSGPLDDLEDRAGVPDEPQVLDALRTAGMEVVLDRRETRGPRQREGWRQLFLTNRETWKREVGILDAVLFVRPALSRES